MKAAPAMPLYVERPTRSAAAAARAPCTVAEHDCVPACLADEWQALAGRSAEPNGFSEPWFVLPGVRHLAERQVRMLEVRAGGALVGMLPVHVAPAYGRMRVRHVEAWRHHNSFLATPIVAAGWERDFWGAVLAHLDAARWAPAFFHINGLHEGGPLHSGLEAAARALGRSAPVVQRSARAELASDLSPQDYYESTVRKKKRKELKRLQNRLAELGEVRPRVLEQGGDLAGWCDEFLALERAGWKGEAGSALACDPATEAFFREALAGADAAGRLHFRRIDLDGRPIAMLVTFLCGSGGFSFKTAFDEDHARFSPGVLIQLDALDLLARPGLAWIDSCAAENHPMIESLWHGRRSVVRVTVRLAGARRGAIYAACRALEEGSALARRLRRKMQ